jgi:hypothetical protein
MSAAISGTARASGSPHAGSLMPGYNVTPMSRKLCLIVRSPENRIPRGKLPRLTEFAFHPLPECEVSVELFVVHLEEIP